MRMIDRRSFLQRAAALAAAGALMPRSASALGARHPGRLPIGFSTLGCPKWGWTAVVEYAAAHKFAAIELRGILDIVDLTTLPEFQPARLARTKRDLDDYELVISDLGASTNLHETDPVKAPAGIAEARGFIDLASRLGVPYVRVFGNKFIPGMTREQSLERISAALRSLGEYAREKNVEVLLETHGDFTDSPTVLEIMRRADSKGAAVLWDAHHTFVLGKEAPETSALQLGPYIRHVHLKDSVPAGTGDDRHYVLTGKGDVPVRRQVEALAKLKYAGYYNFEWEKRWHPEIEEPEVAFAHFSEIVSSFMLIAGVEPLHTG